MKRTILLGAFAALSPCAHSALTTGLVAYYNFEETGTNGIANQVGGGPAYNGTYINGTGISGTGAGFSGNAAYAGSNATNTTDRSQLLVGNALNIAKNNAGVSAGTGQFNVAGLSAANLGPNFTVSAWFHLSPDADNTGSDVNILRDFVFESVGPGGGQYDVSYGTSDPHGSLFNSFIGTSIEPPQTVAGGDNLTIGDWHNVVHAFSSNGATTTLTVYVDGVFLGTASTATSNMDFTSMNFGVNRDSQRVFDGMLDEVAVWNRTLSAAEINNANTGSSADSVYQRGLAGLAIPEPSTALLGGLGMLALLRRRTR